MSKIARTTLSAAAAATFLASAPIGAGATTGALANISAPAGVIKIGGGGSIGAGSNFGMLDVPQPDYSRPNLDYNLPAPGPNTTFKQRAAYCKKTFKTYNPKTGTYIGKDGRLRHCY